jgi:hypothetical protein
MCLGTQSMTVRCNCSLGGISTRLFERRDGALLNRFATVRDELFEWRTTQRMKHLGATHGGIAQSLTNFVRATIDESFEIRR